MSEHPIEGLMGTTMQKIREMVDANTIIGDPITAPDGTTVIPVSKVSYGFAAGGSDFPSKNQPNKDFFGGGSGAGVSVTPIAFLTISNGKVDLLMVQEINGATERMASMVPDLVDKITALFKKDKKSGSVPTESKE